MTSDEERLLGEASRGDEDAIETLLARYLPDVRRFLAGRAGPRLRRDESVSDLVQSVCRDVLEHAADGRLSFRGEAPFREWLYRAAMLKVFERQRYWRAARRDRDREQGPPGGAGSDPLPGTTPSPSEQAVDRESLDALADAFARLDDEQRALIVLAQVEQLGHAEIGARLGISAAHSRTRLSRALARLAKLAGQG